MLNKPELLVFAKRYNRHKPDQIGGAIRLSEELIDDLITMEEPHTVIDINPANYGGFARSYLAVLGKSLKQMGKHKYILFMGSDRVVLYLVPSLMIIAFLYSRRIFLKKIGGGFDKIYEKGGWLKKTLIRWVIKNVVITFFETKHHVAYFEKFGTTMWFPNVRNASNTSIDKRAYDKRFAFISHVKNDKGIIEILQAVNQLDNSYRIHIYGPIIDLEVPQDLKPVFDLVYKGPLRPEEVLETINSYDVILLPTYYVGEGYPGILIEAYTMSKPVITTKWNSIPEIVEDYQTGILVEPGNSEELTRAIEWFNIENYGQLSSQALKYAAQFDSFYQTSDKLKIIKAYE
ncbi:MAG: glycosyltransferase [Flavobacteriaceae bacterium]